MPRRASPTRTTGSSAPPTTPDVLAGSANRVRREPEILDFLAGQFGDCPFVDSGGIVDDARDLGFALENQTRPVYAPEFFG